MTKPKVITMYFTTTLCCLIISSYASSVNISTLYYITVTYIHHRRTLGMVYTCYVGLPDWLLRLYTYVHARYLESGVFPFYTNSLSFKKTLLWILQSRWIHSHFPLPDSSRHLQTSRTSIFKSECVYVAHRAKAG